MLQILKKHKPPEADQADYENFLQCLPDLIKISNRVDDLTAVLDVLWPVYREPVSTGHADLGFTGLYDLFLPKFFTIREEFTENYVEMKRILEPV